MATTAQSIRSFLESLSQLPGSILYRSDLNWKGLPPGEAGQFLTLDQDKMPAWETLHDFQPAMMQYNGSSTRYTHFNVSLSNGPYHLLNRFTAQPHTANQRPLDIVVNGILTLAWWLTPTGQVQVFMADNVGATCAFLKSATAYDDTKPHFLSYQYDPATGTAQFIIDGQNADDPTFPGRQLRPATLSASANADIHVGASNANTNHWKGAIGSTGLKQTNALNWQDFMTPDGWPLPIDHTTWAQFLGKPPVWHESGYLQTNRGSAGPFALNGPLTLADPLTWK